LPWAVLCILLAFTSWTSSRVTTVTRLKNRWHFNAAVLEVEAGITDEVNNFIGMLRGGAALVTVTPDLNRAKFATFVRRLRLETWYPGVQGVGYAQKVDRKDVEPFEAKSRHDGTPDFHIYPAGERAVMFPVVFLQPLDERNQHAIGYDMYSEPVRREAMQRAATDGPVICGKVTLVQEIYDTKQPGFLLYVPVYAPGPFPETAEARQATLRGFIYSPFRAGDFFGAMFRNERGGRLHFTVYDGTQVDKAALLYESTNAAPTRPWFTTNRVLQVAGHHWTIVFATTPAFEHVLGGNTAVLVPMAGTTASIILFAFTFYFVRQHEELLRRSEQRDKAQQQLNALNRELENRVSERTAELQETNSQLEAFIYTVAHDLRTPLRSMRGFAEIVLEDAGAKLDDVGRKNLGRIITAAGQMDRLIKDLLAYSQLSRVKVDLVPVNLDHLMSVLVAEYEPEIERTRAVLAIDAPLPTVIAHEPSLRQVFANLLSNALKFVKPNQPPDVRIYCEPVRSSFVRIWIEDKGVGIGTEHRERIFGVFEQLNPESFAGTGIGLAIVRRAIQRMGGRVAVESELGKGSRFYVELRKA
jgi:signal transduction histidine kinase